MKRTSSRTSGGAKPQLEKPWAASSAQALEILETSQTQGLSEAEASKRLLHYGPNQLRQIERRGCWRILWDQFLSLIVALLVVAAVAAFAFDEQVEGFAIIAVIFINAAIGFMTELRAHRSMEGLRKLGNTTTTVRRGGCVKSLPAESLVPGDIVVLDAGDVLTADIRLITASGLQADESALTGESLAVEKRVASVSQECPLADRTSMLFKGTAVTRGSGEGVVVATGMATELGLISSLVEASEPEVTPLEKRLDALAKRLIVVTLLIAAAMALVIAASGRELFFAIEIAIALAVAAIPEGLPIVATIALARGMWRMARHNALVEQLAAVETLGSTTILLTDKTGTLTENQMTAVEFQLASGRIEVEGVGLETLGHFRFAEQRLEPTDHPELLEALRIGVLCNNAAMSMRAAGGVEFIGDPTEVALLVAGAKAGLLRDELLGEWPEAHELAFDSDTKRMATLHGKREALFAAIKGAPEAILEHCTRVRTGTSARPLDGAASVDWLERANQMAARGERVLALATSEASSLAGFDFSELTLLGLVGLFDPPREQVRSAIDACQAAGIRVVMVTGDHGVTAWTVASAVGLIRPQPGAPMVFVEGRTLGPIAELSEAETESLLSASIIARASPRQKLELIELHQHSGSVVAMIGDGVNDAPALKKADIGIAMGLRGTQVAREAADMVLQDDSLGTIVSAVGQGRAIFANIRKFVIYLMSCNVSEIFVVALGVLAQGPMPILPLQILFLNLVTDVFPALALGVGEGSPALMREAPRNPAEPILTRRHWRSIFVWGALISVCVLAALGSASYWLGKPSQEATSVAFLTLAMAQLWHVFTMRDPNSSRIQNEITGNPWIWAALALCLGLLLLAVHWAPLAGILSIANPGASGWTVAVAFSLIPMIVGQFNPRFAAAREPQRAGSLERF